MDKLSAGSSSTGITCQKFYNRLAYCYYYKERETYSKGVRLLFNRILTSYRKGNDIVTTFAEEFSSRAYVGRNAVEAIDKEEFKTLCLRCAINLDRFFSKFEPKNVMSHYCFKWKIKGFIHGTVVHESTTYNLSLSFEDRNLTEKKVDFFCLNNYLYNKANGTKNSLLIMGVPQDVFYVVPYNDKDYTIKRGFLTFSKGNKLRRRGEHCSNCKHDCKPRFYNGLDRLELTT